MEGASYCSTLNWKWGRDKFLELGKGISVLDKTGQELSKRSRRSWNGVAKRAALTVPRQPADSRLEIIDGSLWMPGLSMPGVDGQCTASHRRDRRGWRHLRTQRRCPSFSVGLGAAPCGPCHSVNGHGADTLPTWGNQKPEIGNPSPHPVDPVTGETLAVKPQ